MAACKAGILGDRDTRDADRESTDNDQDPRELIEQAIADGEVCEYFCWPPVLQTRRGSLEPTESRTLSRSMSESGDL
jgi:hypothetical protein